jgi:cell division septum initiation protein DivIVA
MNARQRLVPTGRDNQQELVNLSAAERAGAMVTEQVRSIIESAENSAAEIRKDAEHNAEQMLRETVEAAHRILDHFDTLEGPLAELVAGLRREADSLTEEHRR